ncbi:MAG: nickel pincer cofactor biosynthesis protein LarC [Planctomycetota bacterium]|nr:nickel pincer cofactor biosynthesis protein LarC [Planctomycetota bacterium]
MRTAILDAWSGVAGDMWVGAMLDAGASIEPLVEVVASLRLPGVAIRSEPVLRARLRGVKFHVDVGGASAPGAFTMLRPQSHQGAKLPSASDHVHRGLADIRRIVEGAAMPDAVRARCVSVYRRIAEVEAAAHSATVDDVHFHEVGAEDTIVDVVCACHCVHQLGIERLYANGIEVGSGTVKAAHGVLPVPAPATAALLAGIPVRTGGLRGERTTPTGAALLKEFGDGFDEAVPIKVEAVGYGAGTRDDADVPNLLRVMVGESAASTSATDLCELSCQLDTATGEQIGWLLDALLQRGATDAFATPITMKKGRPGVLVTVLCEAGGAAALTDLLLEESSSLGVRRHQVTRTVLERWQETRATSLGDVRYKVARLPSGEVVARPEDDEVRRLTAAHGLGRAEVLRRLAADG